MPLSPRRLAATAGLALAGAGLLAGAVLAAIGATSASTVPGPPGGPVPRGFQAASMTFVSPSEGWVLGTAPCA
jgi:hypothetical protein